MTIVLFRLVSMLNNNSIIMEQTKKTEPIFVPWPNKDNIQRRRSMSYPTPPDVKWSEKIRSLLRPEKPK